MSSGLLSMFNTFCNEKQIHITFNAIVRRLFRLHSVCVRVWVCVFVCVRVWTMPWTFLVGCRRARAFIEWKLTCTYRFHNRSIFTGRFVKMYVTSTFVVFLLLYARGDGGAPHTFHWRLSILIYLPSWPYYKFGIQTYEIQYELWNEKKKPKMVKAFCEKFERIYGKGAELRWNQRENYRTRNEHTSNTCTRAHDLERKTFQENQHLMSDRTVNTHVVSAYWQCISTNCSHYFNFPLGCIDFMFFSQSFICSSLTHATATATATVIQPPNNRHTHIGVYHNSFPFGGNFHFSTTNKHSLVCRVSLGPTN